MALTPDVVAQYWPPDEMKRPTDLESHLACR